MTTLLSLTLVLFGLACDSEANRPECLDNSECNELQICTKEEMKCKDVECTASSYCGMHQYCDVQGKSYACKEGCSEDSDCLAGESCNTESHTCQEYGCRSTVLDCAVGQVCENGVCKKAQGQYCQPCSVLLPNCGRTSVCIPSTTDPYNGYCAPECNDGQENACARGFECTEVYRNDPTTYCYGDCDYYTSEGYI